MSFAIYGPEMYLELARAFAGSKIAISTQKPDLKSPHDLSIAAQVNLQFLMNSVIVIYSVSYLEANVNRLLSELLDGTIQSQFTERNFPYPDLRQQAKAGIQNLKECYCDPEKRDRLLRYEKLTDKIKLAYKAFGVPLPFENEQLEIKRTWERLIELQDLRNDLIHLKPEFIESERFMKFLKMDSQERNQIVNVPTVIDFLMREKLPIASVNTGSNVLISEILLMYADKPDLENLMLGSSLSTADRQKYLRRQPHRRI